MENNNVWEAYRQKILEKISAAEIYGHLEHQQPSGNGWISCRCPLHNDQKNSFGYNIKHLSFACLAGCGKGSVFDFIMITSGSDFKETLYELGDKYNIERPFSDTPKKPPIPENLVQEYIDKLETSNETKQYLMEKRGLSQENIKKYGIGWDVKKQRYSIPIRDVRGNLVNIRLYSTKKDPKIISYSDGKWKYGEARLYGIDELASYKGKQIIITEGEWDRLLLQQEGFCAVTGTAGCGTFKPEWVSPFSGKDVVIIYDCDTEGQKAVNNIVLKAFKNSTINSIKNISLPLKGTKDDKDITDYFHRRGFTKIDLQKLIDDTPAYQYKNNEDVAEEIVELTSFIDAEKKEYIDKKIQCDITVCGETSEAFHAVEEFKVTYCQKMKEGKCFECAETIKVPHNSQEYIGICMSTNVQVIHMLRMYCCRYGQKPAIEITKRTTIKEFFCHQKINRITQSRDGEGNTVTLINGQNQELVERKVYYLSSDSVKPGNYLATGYIKTHPKTQQVTFLIESLIPQEDDYQAFKLHENIKHLKEYQKFTLEEIIDDLSSHVTKIYEQDEVLLTILLTYCSPLWIPFNSETIRGWLISLIIGDSGLGKTQTYTRIAEFLNIGDCLSGITSSRTGLAYAMSEHKQKGWQVKIGRYPANSRKILTVDEIQYIAEEDMRTISKGMDEGFLQIDRVASKGYESMTRLIMLANPKYDKVMDTFSYGCESLRNIFPAPVIRRIDLSAFVNAGNVKAISRINRKTHVNGSRKITPAMLRAVIYFAWNLKPGQIVFTPDAEIECLDTATTVSTVFGDATDIPLVSPSDFRHTLARIATAFAVLTLSTNDSFTQLIVKPEHVHMAERLTIGIYSHDNCGLDSYSEIQRKNNQVEDYEFIKEHFIKKRDNEKHAPGQDKDYFMKAIYFLRINDSIRRDDLAEQVGCGDTTTKDIIRFLKSYNLLDSTKRGYAKKPKFIKFLRRFLRECPDFFEN